MSERRRVQVSGYYRVYPDTYVPMERSSPGGAVAGRAARAQPRVEPRLPAGTHDPPVELSGAGFCTMVPRKSTSSTSGEVYVDNAFNRQHGRVGKPLGTHVISKPSASLATYSSTPAVTSQLSASCGSVVNTKCYVDNAYNRKHGRVGKPLGTHVISKSSTPTPTNIAAVTIDLSSGSGSGKPVQYYVDSADDRKHGHVGKPLGTHVISKSSTATSTSTNSESALVTTYGSPRPGVGKCSQVRYIDNAHNRKLTIQEERVVRNTLEDPVKALQHMKLNQEEHYDYEYTRYRLERVDLIVEERLKKVAITSSTAVSCFSSDVTSIPFNELKVEQEIGRGGFGVVHACLWHGTRVAYKKFLLQNLSKKRLDSLVTEIKILAALNHPNTVRLFGIVVEEDKKGIVMEYMQRSLFCAIFIDEEEFTDEKKKRIVGQVASAVEYLHTREQKIAHRDIKSENVLLDSKDNAKLGDFGLSTLKNATESSRSSAAPPPPGQGTPRYSAPEVLRGELLTSIDRLMQTDIYSLAIVVFEVVAEEEPFRDLSIKQLEANIGRGKLRPMSSTFALSHPLLELLAKCWEDSASKRPTATDFHAHWEKISDLYIES